ncbi:MAG: hypothetical protein WC839_02525 [Candidatus Paceibacterota bacterium]
MAGDNDFEKIPNMEPSKIVHEEIEENLDIERMEELKNLIEKGKNSSEDFDELGKLIEKLEKKQ